MRSPEGHVVVARLGRREVPRYLRGRRLGGRRRAEVDGLAEVDAVGARGLAQRDGVRRPAWPDGAPVGQDLGFGRIVALEKEVPNMLVIMV